MKKIKYFLLVLFSITFCWGLVACGQDDAPLIELPVPQNLQMDGRTLIWDENENASYYVVYFDFVEYTTDSASFDLSECLFPYTYEIEVMAVGDAKTYENSDWEKYYYAPEEILPYGYDERGLKYTLLEDGSGYEVSRGELTYNDSRLSGFVDFYDYFCGLPVKKVVDEMFASGGLNVDPLTGRGCNTVITGVHLPKKLESIGTRAFGRCISLEEINIPDTLNEIGDGAFQSDGKLKGEINIPFGLTTLKSGAFSHTGISKVVIPNSVVSIENYAFSFCENLKEVTLPDGIVSLEKGAFKGCSSLIKISAPQSVLRLDDEVFQLCSALNDIPIFKNLEYMGYDVFEDTAWYNSQPDGFVIYRNDILYRYKGALSEGNAINNLPSQIKYIAGGAFKGLVELTSIYVPDGVKLIGGSIFETCRSLTYVRLPQGLDCIPKWTFDMCNSLQFINIPEGVTTIGKSAFNPMGKLKEIILPESLKKIEQGAFWVTPKLEHVFYKGTPAQWEEIQIDIADNYYIRVQTPWFYSETEPTEEGNYWHYDERDGKTPVIWGEEN